MRASVRSGVALSLAGMATGGLVALSAGSAQAAQSVTVAENPTTKPVKVCRYIVNARHGLSVREKPHGKKIGHLAYKKVVYAGKCNNPRGWVKLRKGVKKEYIGKYVYRPYLKRH